jgi:hypothetical protein
MLENVRYVDLRLGVATRDHAGLLDRAAGVDLKPGCPDGGFASQTYSGSMRPSPAVAAIAASRAAALRRAVSRSPVPS